MNRSSGAIALGLALTAVPGSAGAQETRVAQCPDAERVRYIGLTGVACNCTLSGDEWTFRSEPRVLSVAPGSPAAAVLREGDVIVSVDGHLITTAEGGRRLSRPGPGEAVEMAVRRDGRVVQLRLAPESVCADQARMRTTPAVVASAAGVVTARGGRGGVASSAGRTAVGVRGTATVTARGGRGGAQVASGSSTVASAAPRGGRGGGVSGAGVVAAQDALPGAWFGFGISCTSCGWERPSAGGAVRWSFQEPPRILSVESGSPAARAGLRGGDVLTHIDGVSLTTTEGGRRFGAVRPGETVRLTYTRDGATATVEIAAERRPGPTAALAELQRELTAGRDSLVRLYARRAGNATGQSTRDMTAAYERDLIERLRSRAAAARAEERYEELRFSGSVGDTDVEVRGNGSVITTILEQGRDIIIVTGDAQIRVRVREARR